MIAARGVLALAAVVTLSSIATAASADTSCGSIPRGSSGWNVPNGASVFVRGPGPIADVIATIGEYRSHSMLSMGPGGWVTHATSQTPMATGTRDFCGRECMNPIDANFLQNSTPGLEQVTQAAIYTFLYGGGGQDFIAYQNGLAEGYGWGQAVSNYAWSLGQDGFDWGWAASSADGTQGYYFITYEGAHVHYGWNQYMNIQNVNRGIPGLDTGVVCSTSLTMWQSRGANGPGGRYGDVLPRTYPPSKVDPAANALFNSVKSQCEQGNGFFASLGSALQQIGFAGLCGTCGSACSLCWAGVGCGNMNSYDGDPCDEAADQMVNTFASNMPSYGDDCNYDNEHHWWGVVRNTSAVSASPDDVACWNGNGSGAPCSGPGSSIWGYDINEMVQWNSGGTTYGCWD